MLTDVSQRIPACVRQCNCRHLQLLLLSHNSRHELRAQVLRAAILQYPCVHLQLQLQAAVFKVRCCQIILSSQTYRGKDTVSPRRFHFAPAHSTRVTKGARIYACCSVAQTSIECGTCLDIKASAVSVFLQQICLATGMLQQQLPSVLWARQHHHVNVQGICCYGCLFIANHHLYVRYLF